MSEGRDLLFEIGCEEIPAKMLARALADLPGAVGAKLATARLAHGEIRALGTPRRIAIVVAGLAERQPDLDEQIVGPPAQAAYAADGTLTKAGQGFAAKNGVAESALDKKEVAGKKGLYVVATRHVAGEDTRKLLPDLLRELAAGISWPKSMRWGWSDTVFVRPVQWLVALYGGEPVPFEWAGQKAGRKSRGHRFLAPGMHDIADAAAYAATLRTAYVEVDPAARRTRVNAELTRLEGETGLRTRPDPALLDEVIHLGEWPVGVSGGFDAAFLEVPEEMIVTAMRTHQRYFALEDAEGKLAPKFVAITATVVKQPRVVAQGNEKVLASRLTDAKFFFGEDRKKTFDDWNAKLDGVVFQAKLGDKAKTIGDKVRRIERIVEAVAANVACDRDIAAMIARRCKADLASLAVGEFPELQGTMGKHYARAIKLDERVALGIEQHWWPKGRLGPEERGAPVASRAPSTRRTEPFMKGGELPQSIEAALVSLADKMDTVLGCFAVGLEPSGSADPFGLRRAAIGIWQVLLADPKLRDVFVALSTATRAALAQGGVTLDAKADKAATEFFRTRLRGILVDAGVPTQDAAAALAQGFVDPIDARARALACAKISKEAREVFKRVANILDDARAKTIEIGAAPLPQLFVAPVEHALHDAIKAAQLAEYTSRTARDYAAVFESLERLRPTVATFFDKGGVMVMDPDHKLRDNRLALLNWFVAPYMAIADFRLLAGGAS